MDKQKAIETLRKAKSIAFNKKTWRYDLCVAWMQGNYRTFGWDDMAGELQQIRNTLGPSWLARVSLKN